MGVRSCDGKVDDREDRYADELMIRTEIMNTCNGHTAQLVKFEESP